MPSTDVLLSTDSVPCPAMHRIPQTPKEIAVELTFRNLDLRGQYLLSWLWEVDYVKKMIQFILL